MPATPRTSRACRRLQPLLLAVVAGSASVAEAQTVANWHTAASGSWFDAARWTSNPAVPTFDGTTSYRAVIDAAGSLYSISLLNNIRLASLRVDSSSATVLHTGGVLDLDGTADLVQGFWRLDGGTIRGGTIAAQGAGTSLRIGTSAASVLEGVTLAGAHSWNLPNPRVTICNGLTFASGGSLAVPAQLLNMTFDGAQSISGGTISTPSLLRATLTLTPASMLTVSPTTVIEGSFAFGGGAGSSLVLNGALRANITGQTSTLTVPTVTVGGTLEASNSATLNVSGLVANQGTVRADGGTVLLNGGVTGSGAVVATNSGVVRFTGTVASSSIAAVQTSSGGSAVLAGTMDNTGATYSHGAGSPAIGFDDARVLGGTFAFADGRTLEARQVLEFDGTAVTGAARFQTATGSAPLTVALMNGASLASGATFTNEAWLAAAGSSTLTGELNFQGPGLLHVGHEAGIGHTTLSTGAHVMIGAGRNFEFRPGNNIDRSVTTLINRGTISGGGTGSTVKVRTGSFSNEGVMNFADGTTLWIGESAHSGFAGTQWSNTGTIRARNGVVRMTGGFTLAGTSGLDFAGSQVSFYDATINNAGRTLVLNGATSAWSFDQVRVNGGTVRVETPTPFTMVNNQTNVLALNGTRLEGTLNMRKTTPDGGSWPLSIQGGLDLEGTLLLGGGTAVQARGSQTWDGGTIDMRGTEAGGGRAGLSYINLQPLEGQPSATIALGPDMLIRGIRGGLGGAANAYYVNYGRIQSDFPGGVMHAGNLTNYGVLEAVNAGHLSIGGVDNHGILRVVDGGVLNIGGTTISPVRFLSGSTIIRGGGAINLMGVIDNAGRTLTIDSTTGYFAGRGGQIVGGTVNIGSGGGFNLSTLTVGGTPQQKGLELHNTTLNGDLYQPINGGPIRLGNMTLNGTATLESADGMVIGARDSLATTVTGGTIVLNPQGSTRVRVITAGATTVTLSPTTLIRGGGTSPGFNSTAQLGVEFADLAGYTTIINQGRVSADVPGTVLTIRPNIFRNEGVLEATNGGTVEILSNAFISWSNPTGVIRATAGGVVDLNGNIPTSALGTLDTHGGTLNFRGRMNNPGAVLTLSPTTSGSLTLVGGGRITGGTIVAPANAPLRVGRTLEGAVLDGVTINGDIRVGDLGRLGILSSFTTSGSIYLEGSESGVGFEGPRTLASAEIVFAGMGGERDLQASGVVTLGPGVVVRGGNGRVFTSTTNGFINQGLISADVGGQAIRIYQQQFTNSGTIQAINGGQIVFVPPGGIDGPAPVVANAGRLIAGVLSELSFTGGYRQLPGGVLEIALGMDESAASGWLEASEVELGGMLHVHAAAGTALVEGNAFHVLRAGRISGRFDGITLPALDAPLRWDVAGLYSQGIIAVVPAPSGVVACLAFASGLAARRRRS